MTPVSALIPPRASGLGEPLDSAWDTGASSSRATGRSLLRASAEDLLQPAQLPAFHLGPAVE